MSLVDRFDAFQRRHPVIGFPLGVIYKFFDDSGGYLAALITYYAFVSLFPLLLLLATVLSWVLSSRPDLQEEIIKLKAELERLGRPDIMITIGGVIPPDDIQTLIDMGAAAVYPPGSVIAETAIDLIEKLNQRLGYAQPAPRKEPA